MHQPSPILVFLLLYAVPITTVCGLIGIGCCRHILEPASSYIASVR